MKGFLNLFIMIVIAITAIAVSGYLALEKNTKPVSNSIPVSESSPTLPLVEEQEKASAPKQKAEPKPSVLLTPSKKQNYVGEIKQTRDPWKDSILPAPVNLVLPFVAADIKEGEELLSPYGIIRHSRDGGIGHGGIDFPFESGSPFYAVADGTIIKNDLEDSGGGKTVDVLIAPGKFSGEGWIFKYEHIALEPGLVVGSSVRKGQKIGTNAFEQRGNNHVGLEYHIKNFTVAREKNCWVDYLEANAKQQLEHAFNEIKNTPSFLQSWQTANEEGYYQYKGLLDKTKYPNGPELCYQIGTDVRIPVPIIKQPERQQVY